MNFGFNCFFFFNIFKYIFRVVYPEDLNLCSPEEVKKKPVKPIKRKPKQVNVNVEEDPVVRILTLKKSKCIQTFNLKINYFSYCL